MMNRIATIGFTMLVVATAGPAMAAPILTGASIGQYNANLGTILDNSAGFPCANSVCGDPVVNPAPEPDLSAAAAILGDWLGDPPALNANWTAPQVIPANWAINTETAIVYPFTLTEASQLTGNFGVDNGLYIWVNGIYKFGAMAPGGSFPGEYANLDLGVLGAGTHYLQILREDHGGATGFDINVDATAVPEPATLLLMLGATAAGVARATRRRHASKA